MNDYKYLSRIFFFMIISESFEIFFYKKIYEDKLVIFISKS